MKPKKVSMGSRLDLIDLAKHLRQEHLFVQSERQHIQMLNDKVLKTVESLYHIAWIAKQQRINLDSLILTNANSHPAACCNRANALENVTFVDSYKHLGIHDSIYADFLQQFRDDPKLIALCLDAGEKQSIESMHSIVPVILASVYGNCVLPEDEAYVLRLLRELMTLQLATSENPRRLLRHGSCAFSRSYKAFTEGLFSAKLFLTAALHDPLMHLLMEDDLFLDIDPGKAAVRFMPQERLRHFGREGTPEYAANLQKYRNLTTGRLVALTNRFIEGIRSNLYCFPQSLSWLVRQMYSSLMRAKRVEVREVGAMCADLVFAFFVCPAIVNPEPYGITDAPISHIARFNLMQVAQILQVLAMSKWEEIDPKLLDLYGKFPKDCMSSLLDLILDGSSEDSPSTLASQLCEMTRFAVLITESELHSLIAFLRNVQNDWQDGTLQKAVSSLLGNLQLIGPNKSPKNGNTPNATPFGTPPHTPVAKRNLLGKVSRRSLKATATHPPADDEHLANQTDGDGNSQGTQKREDVLVIPLNNTDFECPGMWSEEKVLTIEQQQKQNRVRMNLENLVNEEVESVTSGPEMVEKRTRFSLSQDQESVGTSDNLEAISEAASNHSVASSLDLENENENDNLSDMVSANVSGRGTPNVSGRDTPSSQLEGEEQRPLDFPPVVVNRKQNQVDMDDKFGRFEINPLTEGDETKSMVSDTWSTDVLASDSETVEQTESSLHVINEPQMPGMLLDISETASQSDAWSTDVMPSDTERLQELDTDDTASVARSDDTTRSEIEADGTIEILRVEQGELLDELEFVNQAPSGSPGITERFQYSFPSLRRGSQEGSAFREVRRNSQGVLSDSMSAIAPPEVQITFSKSSIQENGIYISTSSMKFTECSEEETLLNPLSVEVDNTTEVANMSATEDLTPTGNSPHHSSVLLSPTNADRTQQDNSLTDIQSLGRLSLAMRELPEAGNLKCAAFLLDTLQDLAGSGGDVTSRSNHTAHRSSVADLLNLDLTKALNSQQQQSHQSNTFHEDPLSHVVKDVLSKSGSRHSLSDVRGSGKHRGGTQQQEETTRLSSTSMSSSSSSCSGGPDHPAGEATRGGFATGAIPKSISFDKSADKAYRELENDERNDDRNRKSFFKLTNFKFAFKGRSRKSRPGVDGYMDSVKDKLHSSSSLRHIQRNFSEDSSASTTAYSETTEEILAKYRKKAQPEHSAPEPPSTPLEGSADDDSQVFEPSSESFAFADAKRKLRLVLGSSDIQTLPWLSGANGGRLQCCTNGPKDSGTRDNELVAFLKVLLAEAINLQQRQLVAHLHEALRCVRIFDDTECQKLLRSLKRDYRKRAPYIAYLVRCRQGLLSTLAHLETLVERINRDKQVCSKYLVSMCVRMFLEKEERSIRVFVDKFQALTVSDEKAQLVEKFLNHLFGSMETDPMWQTASEAQMEDAQTVVERTIMSKIYIYALYPNGDGDMLRDQVLHQHMEKLSQVITPNHKDLRIPKMYHHECPWPSAQAEIITINAYKTPRDKIQCVVRCCSTIMNLLSMASSKSVPAADDFMPVLVYVLVKANPPSLLSTAQYVNTLHEKHLEGEDAYWWTQFSSAIEFIKTMDY